MNEFKEMNEINWFSVLISSFIPFGIAFLFSRTWLFGRVHGLWMNSILTPENFAKRYLRISVFILMSFVISIFMINFNNDGLNQEGDYDTFLHGLWHGVVLSIFIIIPTSTMTGLSTKDSWKALMINAFYWLLCFSLIGGIVDAMNHWENIPFPTG